jgi:hypothetical protein
MVYTSRWLLDCVTSMRPVDWYEETGSRLERRLTVENDALLLDFARMARPGRPGEKAALGEREARRAPAVTHMLSFMASR